MGPWEGTQDGTHTSWQLLPGSCLHMPAAATLGGKDAGEGCRDSPHHPSGKHQPQLRLGLTQGSAGSLSSCWFCLVAGGKRRGPCVSTRMSPSPSWPEPAALRQTLTSKAHLPGCSGPPKALPTHNPPGQGGITVQTSCAAGQSSLPGTAGGSMDSRGARRGAGPAPGGQRTGRGAGEHPRARPGSGLRPGTTRHTLGVCQTDGLGGPSGASPPTARAAFPLPAPSVCTGAAAQTPAGEKRLRKEMEKARRSWQVESRRGRGHLRPGAGCQGASGGAHLAGAPGCAAGTALLCFIIIRGN